MLQHAEAYILFRLEPYSTYGILVYKINKLLFHFSYIFVNFVIVAKAAL